MPKNIYLPKDNLPKIFEVREIENEIPSYEEFLKNYQQEQVNYEDLTHNEINSDKSCGPMWGNNQYGECLVPVSGYSNTSITSQIHVSCSGQVEISNQARVRCQRCRVVGDVRNWNLSCSDHSENYNSSQTDISCFTRHLLIAVRLRMMDESLVDELRLLN
ncbi:MAG: hypothetical protein MRERC_9c015 [Mycoplasmataceae bacterium RC_NB112A]|nr:MAG: hypothetical protein MRERC_9c015 [Mycoplasmataceae bacterium RC_NB112A]